ncbi:uridine kinase [Geodermatophilus marinus]|nr:uridine kinase [Geodermatophilus sp. LHW52908]
MTPGAQPAGATGEGAARVAALAARVRDAAPRLGRTRLVCVDGPAGSGKTTLGRALATALGAPLVHMDDLYAGWTLTGAWARLAAGVLRPLAGGADGAYHRYDWAAGRFAPVPVGVPSGAALVVEGCGSCPRAADPWAVLRVWVEAPAALRLARGLARDGVALAPQWRRWQGLEAAVFAAEGTRERADVRVDGTGGRP